MSWLFDIFAFMAIVDLYLLYAKVTLQKAWRTRAGL